MDRKEVHNGDFAIDEESTREKVIPMGITSS
jgi:hypothetical protein